MRLDRLFNLYFIADGVPPGEGPEQPAKKEDEVDDHTEFLKDIHFGDESSGGLPETLHWFIGTYNPNKSGDHTEYDDMFAEAVRQMIETGEDPSEKNIAGESAIDVAINNNLPDVIKAALGIIEADEIQPNLAKLYEEGLIYELFERKESADLTSDREVNSAIQKMIEAADFDTLKRFIKPSDIKFRENPDFWSSMLFTAISKIRIDILGFSSEMSQEDIGKLKQIALFLLNNGVSPDYLDPMHGSKFRFNSSAEEVRRHKLLPNEVAEIIREKSLYLKDHRLADLRNYMDKYYSSKEYQPMVFMKSNSSKVRLAGEAYNEYILNPTDANFEKFNDLFTVIKNENPY